MEKRAAKPAEEDFGSRAGLAGLESCVISFDKLALFHNKKHSQAFASLTYPLSIWILLGL